MDGWLRLGGCAIALRGGSGLVLRVLYFVVIVVFVCGGVDLVLLWVAFVGLFDVVFTWF